ncbi:glycosyltransferase [Bordetella genomosp. 13]|uniref:Glycosyl transferase family 1 n=1 Tax=Bordetella genomosp. 13 TaxID=463040 RepID=A0A1W6ZGS6_9BORD|nr:glycosyltransferase [Bordetella genomosp. 13]ARP96529.1 glycosyl transferase family 1 [Bordetella genomosp. 13]
MKILYTNFHGGDGGGHTTYVLTLARALAGRHDVTVAAPASSRLYARASENPSLRAIPLPFSTRVGRLWRECLSLRRFLRRELFDIVHVNGSVDHRLVMLSIMGMGGKRPSVVYTKHNDLWAGSTGNLMRARFATDRVVCVCEYTRRALSASPYSDCGLRVVHNGVDTDYYSPFNAADTQAARRQWVPQAGDDALLVGSNAGTPDYKGWIDMVKAVAELPETQRRRVYVLLAGRPPTEAQRAQVEHLGMSGNVVFAGLLQDVRPFIAALDLGFVLSHQETISFACREMMAMGKPVIVSRVGGLPENVTPGRDGWIVPSRTPKASTQILQELLDDRSVLARLGAEARQRSLREFSLDTFVQGTEAVYQELMDAHSGRALTLPPG